MKKNIDRLFQEKLKDFEQLPSKDLWKNIEAELDNKKEKKRILPFWYYLSGAAGVIALLFVLNNNNAPEKNNTPIITKVDTQKNQEKKLVKPKNQQELNVEKFEFVNSTKEEKPTKPAIKSSVIIPNNSTLVVQNKVNRVDNKIKSNNTVVSPIFSSEKQANTLINENNNAVALNDNKQSSEKTSVVSNKNNVVVNDKEQASSLEKDINEEEAVVAVENSSKLKDIHDILDDKEEDETTLKKWKIAPVVAPVAFSPFESKGSYVDDVFANTTKTTKTSISYGVKLNYKLSKRFSLQGGVNVLKLAYSNSNVYIKESTNARIVEEELGVPISNTGMLVSPTGKAFLSELGNEMFSDSGELNHQFGYVEFPVEMKYQFNNVNNKFGMSLIGGFSALILNENKVEVITPNFYYNLGASDNLSTINFSGNVGLDFSYKLSNNLHININPMLKVQSNTYSESYGNLSPYLLGVYSGLNFSF